MKRRILNVIMVMALAGALSAHASAAGTIQRISPLTTYPVAAEQNGIYQTVEHISIGEIGQKLPTGSKVSVSGYNLTTGYKFDKGRVEYTYMNYQDTTTPAGVLQSDTMGANVFHAAYTLTVAQGYGKWTGDAVLGVRYFKNGVGELGEIYAAREFQKDKARLNLGLNALERSTRFNRRVGVYADARLEYRPNLSVIGQYYSADFYKNIMNDYVAPYMYWIDPSQNGCDPCSEDTAAVGLSLNFMKGRGNAYFMYYYIGEQYGYIPMLGVTAKL